jgi:predicted nucleotidyltransferase
MEISNLKDKIVPLLRQYSVNYAGIFGSVARGEDKPDSDIDVLVRFKNVPGMFEYIRLENELSEQLGKKVDLATEQSLHRLIKPQIMRDLKTIYEER